jgi:hypothetical protein
VLEHEQQRAARPVGHRCPIARLLDAGLGKRRADALRDAEHLLALGALPRLLQPRLVEGRVALVGDLLGVRDEAHQQIVALAIERPDEGLDRLPRRRLAVEIEAAAVDAPPPVLVDEHDLVALGGADRGRHDGIGSRPGERPGEVLHFLGVLGDHAPECLERHATPRVSREERVGLLDAALSHRLRVCAQRVARALLQPARGAGGQEQARRDQQDQDRSPHVAGGHTTGRTGR